MFSDGFMLDPNSLNFGASNPQAMYFQRMGPTNMEGLGLGSMQDPSGLNNLFGFNLGTGQLVLGGLGTLGNLWNSWRMHNLARDQFKFQKDVINTNLRNQIQSYNTRLEGLARNRGYLTNEDESATKAYIERHRLRR